MKCVRETDFASNTLPEYVGKHCLSDTTVTIYGPEGKYPVHTAYFPY